MLKNTELLKHSKITLCFLTLCASVGSEKVSTLFDARCNHEICIQFLCHTVYRLHPHSSAELPVAHSTSILSPQVWTTDWNFLVEMPL